MYEIEDHGQVEPHALPLIGVYDGHWTVDFLVPPCRPIVLNPIPIFWFETQFDGHKATPGSVIEVGWRLAYPQLHVKKVKRTRW